MSFTDRERRLAEIAYQQGVQQAGAAAKDLGRSMQLDGLKKEIGAVALEMSKMKPTSWQPPSGGRAPAPSGGSLSASEKETARRMGLDPAAYARGKAEAVRKGLHRGGTPPSINGD